MPIDAMGGDEDCLHNEEQHPECESRAVDVQDRTGERGAQQAGHKVCWREANENADGEQDRHTAVEDAFDGSIDKSVCGLLAGCLRENTVCCHCPSSACR